MLISKLCFVDVVLMGKMEEVVQKEARNWKTSKWAEVNTWNNEIQKRKESLFYHESFQYSVCMRLFPGQLNVSFSEYPAINTEGKSK